MKRSTIVLCSLIVILTGIMAYALHRAERSPSEGVSPIMSEEAPDAGAPFRSDEVLFASSTLGVTLRSVGITPAQEWRPFEGMLPKEDDLLFAAEVRMAPYISTMCTAKIYIRALPLSGSHGVKYGDYQIMGNETFRVETDNLTLCGLELVQEVGEGMKIMYAPTENTQVPASAVGSMHPMCPAYWFFFGERSSSTRAERGVNWMEFYKCKPADIRFKWVSGSRSKGIFLVRDLSNMGDAAWRFEERLDLSTGVREHFRERGVRVGGVSSDGRYMALIHDSAIGSVHTHAIQVIDLLTDRRLTAGVGGLSYLPAGWVVAGDDGLPIDIAQTEGESAVVAWNANRRIEVSITRASGASSGGVTPSTRSYFIAY